VSFVYEQLLTEVIRSQICLMWNWQMGMSTPSVCWISLAVVLSLSSFGLYGCFWIAAAVFAFIAGYELLLDAPASFQLC